MYGGGQMVAMSRSGPILAPHGGMMDAQPVSLAQGFAVVGVHGQESHPSGHGVMAGMYHVFPGGAGQEYASASMGAARAMNPSVYTGEMGVVHTMNPGGPGHALHPGHGAVHDERVVATDPESAGMIAIRPVHSRQTLEVRKRFVITQVCV